MDTEKEPERGKQAIEALGANEVEMRRAVEREQQWLAREALSPGEYEEEMADAHMLMLWGGIGLAAGAAICLALPHVGLGFAVFTAMSSTTLAITLAAVVAALRRHFKRRAS